MLKALHSELDSFSTALRQIQHVIELDPHGDFAVRQIFPDYVPCSAVYLAFTPKIGLVRDSDLRTGVIRVYAELDLFFFSLNRNSRILEKNKNGTVFQGNDFHHFCDTGRQLRASLVCVTDEVERIKKKLVMAASVDS